MTPTISTPSRARGHYGLDSHSVSDRPIGYRSDQSLPSRGRLLQGCLDVDIPPATAQRWSGLHSGSVSA